MLWGGTLIVPVWKALKKRTDFNSGHTSESPGGLSRQPEDILGFILSETWISFWVADLKPMLYPGSSQQSPWREGLHPQSQLAPRELWPRGPNDPGPLGSMTFSFFGRGVGLWGKNYFLNKTQTWSTFALFTPRGWTPRASDGMQSNWDSSLSHWRPIAIPLAK